MRTLAVYIVLLISTAIADQTSYDGFKVYNAYPTTEEHVEIIQQLESQDDYDFWSDLRQIGDAVQIMVPPTKQKEFESFLSFQQIQFTGMIDDVQKLIDEESEQQAKADSRGSSRRLQWDRYYGTSEINEYIAYLSATYPNLVTIGDAGLSLEGRGLIFAKISSNPNARKPIVLIDGGIHAREWISPATVTYIIYQLVENATNRFWLNDLDWYILPVLNPDGYEFSRSNTRLWRKTRSRGTSCFGTDGNRNFDFFWGTVGASTNQCSETFRGARPNSEIETRNFISFLQPYASRIRLYLSYHSFGNYFLYPWGYVNRAPSNGAELQSLGNAAAAAIRAISGRRYTVGVSSTTLYATSGSSVDYVYGVFNVTLSYTVELPGEGVGFIWPPARILPVAYESWRSVEVFAGYVARLYGQK